LNNSNQINNINNLSNEDERKIIIKNIKSILDENIIKQLENTKVEEVEARLSNIPLINCNQYSHKNNNLFYFYNCQIINSKIFALIQKFVPNIKLDNICFIIIKSRNYMHR
jgi:hypothetical protein